MAPPDMDVIKEIPGYKVILKAVLKTQIQQLVEQLASHTDEESVILTASVSDGTLSHLGSDSGKNFLDDHEDIKSQFLGFCLKRHHKKKVQQEQEEQQKVLQQQQELLKQQQLAQQARNPPWPHLGPGPRSRFGTPPRQSYPRHSIPRHPMSVPGKGVRHEPYPISNPQRTRSIDSIDSIVKAATDSLSGDSTIVKQEPDETSQHSGTEAGTSPSQGNDSNNQQGSESKDSNAPDGNSNSSDPQGGGAMDPNVNVKMEDMTDSDLELEITGVELGEDQMASQADPWSAANMAAMGYDPSGATGGPGDMQNMPDYTTGPSRKSFGEMLEITAGHVEGEGQMKMETTEPSSAGNVENSYSCNLCLKTFRNKWKLETHYRIHTGEKPFSCQCCEKTFNVKGNLKTHMVKMHGRIMV